MIQVEQYRRDESHWRQVFDTARTSDDKVGSEYQMQ